jgi:hypothetical protein
MNIDKINSSLTLFTNLGVLFGIFILIIELQQNTTAIEADVTWAHAAAAQDLYLPVALDPEVARFVTASLKWSEAEYESYRQGSTEEYLRFSTYMSVVTQYYQSRYYTQRSQDERKVLAEHVRIQLTRSGAFGFFIDGLPEGWVLPEFSEFLHDIHNNVKS